ALAPAPAMAAAASTPTDPFAAILDERARALLASAGPSLASVGARPQRTAVIARVIWQTVATEPVYRVEAMAYLLPDGRLRWGVLATGKEADAVETATDLAYPEGALGEGFRRPLSGTPDDCTLPMIPLADAATLPEVARTDQYEHGYGRTDACRIADGGVADAWVMSLDWFGVLVHDGDSMALVSAPVKVDHATLAFTGAPAVTPMAKGTATPILDAGGGPLCPTAADCFEVAARAFLTGEQPLMMTAYGRACDGGHGLACIQMAGFVDDPAGAEELRRHGVANFRASCAAGTALDCAYLGIALETGQGVARDEKAAVAAYRQACKANEPLGCFNLGGMEREGRGTKLDRKAAHRDYQHACDLGDDGACDAASKTR
ncbi:MAG TPA: tetratricopeptide repeat protein, partial [Kofleriaceae bacterium]|nr:tetratricopeptide repeat protein [Kofleriaceae bacterium]